MNKGKLKTDRIKNKTGKPNPLLYNRKGENEGISYSFVHTVLF